jgi:hemerythrin
VTSTSISTVVEWSDIYELGLPEIDEQHKTLFAMINDLWQAVIARDSGDRIKSVLAQLEHYTIRHFTDEELLMRGIAYPNFASHRRAHLEFVNRIAQERGKHAADEVVGLEILHFLNDWLVEHILTADRGYADHYARLAAPRPELARLFSST